MARYIDADAFEVVSLHDKSDEFCEGARYILEKIDAAPTANVSLKSELTKEIFAEIDRMCIDLFGNFNHKAFIEIKNKYIES